jgi:hypothetical protein
MNGRKAFSKRFRRIICSNNYAYHWAFHFNAL